eukprot:Cvel_11564.t1-p1 / transcript=Cvel_11564.t1 / gene=Cvel_11564 / organism=Chromera_velia_CCMP2878 / gene_product=hypothetical protein / transcript_product=hypothetical protein / location=Cvel_scaffold731:723-2098(-) / protein_length=189 / sequence_SO=supercontig / SO=protein_coding / is_pseudo=false
MNDPVTGSDGFTYERDELMNVLASENPVSPMTREPLQKTIYENKAIKRAIEAYKANLALCSDHNQQAIAWCVAHEEMVCLRCIAHTASMDSESAASCRGLAEGSAASCRSLAEGSAASCRGLAEGSAASCRGLADTASMDSESPGPSKPPQAGIHHECWLVEIHEFSAHINKTIDYNELEEHAEDSRDR